MKPPPCILAATDLSVSSHHAVERALQLASATASRCEIVHTLQLELLDSVLGRLRTDTALVKRRLEAEARGKLDEVLKEVRGVSASARILHGAPVQAITEAADELDAALLVVGVRGESQLRRALLGSVASRLVRTSNSRPVLVVKQAPQADYRRVLVPVDFSAASERAIRLARWLAPSADIVLLHAFALPYEGKLFVAGVGESEINQYVADERKHRFERLREFAARAGLGSADHACVVAHGDTAQQILADERDRLCDLIVLGKHGEALHDLLLGSVTKHVLDESLHDVLILPDARLPFLPELDG